MNEKLEFTNILPDQRESVRMLMDFPLHKPLFLCLCITRNDHESLKHIVQDCTKTCLHCTEHFDNLSLLDL